MRDDRKAKAETARQLLDEPMIAAAFAALDEKVLDSMKSHVIDGSDVSRDYVIELARKLQTNAGVKKYLQAQIDAFKLSTKP